MHTRATLFHLLFLLIPFHFQFLLLISTSQFPLASQGCHGEERKALLNFKSSLEDPSNLLSSWQQGRQNCCDWHGIGCSNDSFHVIKIDLQNMELDALHGKISPWLFKITHLEYLDLSGNDFYLQNEIPFQFANLTKLAHLDLSNSMISGSLTTQFANLSASLQYLDLSRNYFQGSIPESICEIIPLQELRLSHNNISGSIPSCITNLRHVSTFDVSGNSIDGIVPLISWINKLNLTEIDLSGNRLTVIIDQDLPLSQFKLQSLKLGSCNISGSIPTFICNLTNLEYLDLSDNHLTRDIPSCLYKLEYLTYFDFLNAGFSSPAGPPFFRGPQPEGPPPQYNYAIENVLFYGDVALGFIVGFWGLFFGLLLKKEKWWCGYWRFVDDVATRIVRGCRQLIHVCTEMVVG